MNSFQTAVTKTYYVNLYLPEHNMPCLLSAHLWFPKVAGWNSTCFFLFVCLKSGNFLSLFFIRCSNNQNHVFYFPVCRKTPSPEPEELPVEECLYLNENCKYHHCHMCHQSAHQSWVFVVFHKCKQVWLHFFQLLFLSNVCVQTGNEEAEETEDSSVNLLSRKSLSITISLSNLRNYWKIFTLTLHD